MNELMFVEGQWKAKKYSNRVVNICLTHVCKKFSKVAVVKSICQSHSVKMLSALSHTLLDQ